MAWQFILDFESPSSTSSDNPWAGSRPQPVGKVSVAFPAGEWLCKKIEDLNHTKPPKSQLHCYDVQNQPDPAVFRPGLSVYYWFSNAPYLIVCRVEWQRF